MHTQALMLAAIPATGGGDTIAVTVTTLGPATRNDFSDYVGLMFAPIPSFTITEVGRLMLSGNSQVHTMRGFLSDNTVVFEKDLDMTGGTIGQFKWVTLDTPFVFSGGAQGSYLWVMSKEFSGGDLWYDSSASDTVVDIDGTIAANYSGVGPTIRGGYFYNNVAENGINHSCYGPVNFKYHL